jgi:hypothetical protein
MTSRTCKDCRDNLRHIASVDWRRSAGNGTTPANLTVTNGLISASHARPSCESPARRGRSGPTNAQQEPSHYFLVRIAAAALELILLHSPLSEGCSLFFGLSLILRKLHPFADDLSARLVFFHVRGFSLGLNFLDQQSPAL